MGTSIRNWLGKAKDRRAAKRASSRRPLLEQLEDRAVPAITLPTPGTPGPVAVTGTAGPDQFVIRLQAGTPTNIQFSDNNGATFQTAALADVTQITVQGLAGNDRLTIDNSNGLVAAAAGLAIDFQGGAGADTLFLRGGTAASETFTAGDTAGSGTLTVTGAGGAANITFSRVSDVQQTTSVTTLTVNLNGANNRALVTNGPTIDGLNTTLIRGVNVDEINDVNLRDENGSDVGASDMNASDGNASDMNASGGNSGSGSTGGGVDEDMVSFAFANKANVTINALGGNDLVSVDLTRPSAGLTSLTIDGGAGDDTLVGRNLPPGVTTTLNNVEHTANALDDIFIRELYHLRLGRSASDAEVAAWRGVLQTLGRLAVSRGIELSEEARDNLVRTWYRDFLGRNAGNGEELGWVRAMTRAGLSEEAVLSRILGSAEFFQKAQSLITTGTPNERFIRALYSVVLNRTASPAEVNGWVNLLPTLGLQGVAQNFLQSVELRGDVVRDFYENLLHRGADDGGLRGWAFSGLSLADIRSLFQSSDEFFLHG